MNKIPFAQIIVGAIFVAVVGGLIVHTVTVGPRLALLDGMLRSNTNQGSTSTGQTTGQIGDLRAGAKNSPAAEPQESLDNDGEVAKQSIGIVTAKDGWACLSIQEERLPAGTLVYVVTLDHPQRLLKATVRGQRTTGCEFGLESSYRSYTLEPDAWGFSYLDLAVGIIGLSGPPLQRGGLMIAPLGKGAEGVTFRQCTSSEGLHMTAWEGSKRIWHVYYYLGYDTDPTCGEGEI